MVLFLLSIGLLAYLLLYAKKSALLGSFIFFHIMTILWTMHAIVSIISAVFITDENVIRVLSGLVYRNLSLFIGGATGLAWLLFSLNYVGWQHVRKPRIILLICTPSIVVYAILIYSSYRYLYYGFGYTLGLFYLIYSILSYSCSLAGFVVILIYAFRQEKYEKSRTMLLVGAYLIPLAYLLYRDITANILPVRRLHPPYITLAPLAFFAASVLIIFIIARYRFLNITPMAANRIVENLSMAVLIVDSTHRVINMNKSLIENFSAGKAVLHNDSIAFLNDYIGQYMVDTPSNYAILSAINSVSRDFFKGELSLVNHSRKYYEVVVQPVMEDNVVLGRIISFDDITQIKFAIEQMEKQNKTLSYLNDQLLSKNEQLKYYASTAEELAIVKERQRFSRDIHDTLGHTMTVLITQLKVAEILCSTQANTAKAKISEALLVAKEGLNELRKSIMGIAPGRLAENNIEASVLKLINDFKTTGMKIDVTVNGEFDNMPEEHTEALFRLCQEALTNSLRHGRADHVDIVMNSAEGRLKVLIKDNGAGCRDMKKGFGLKGMEQRISSLGGMIHYGSDGENGFNIFVELPVKEEAAE